MRMVWDEPKREKNRQPPPSGHGLDFADARDRFEWDTAAISESYSSKSGSARYIATGYLDGKLVTLTFSLLGTEAISAISLRTASNRERRAYVAQSE
ncbi:BrnT family toxin [Methylobacterium sp. SyP6R]|uniref:BrnT family toxin n=1 Tax=Methylobacterium sp. SyP6R TaxID=2718876 RepID=UPI001F45BB66|nr:BrnT family toxin [Methylobacterium sp. SyP6R]MCF4129363.1 BrnT family toxin [Methylobacterium sp. SyP6R]